MNKTPMPRRTKARPHLELLQFVAELMVCLEVLHLCGVAGPLDQRLQHDAQGLHLALQFSHLPALPLPFHGLGL